MTPWTVCSPQASLSMGFPRQEYWNGVPFPSPGDLPRSGIEPRFPAFQADSLLLSYQGSPYKAVMYQLSRKFGTNSVGHKNLKLDEEYNLFVKRTFQINSLALPSSLVVCASL